MDYDYKAKDYMILVTGFLSAIKVLLSARGIKIGDDVVNAIADVIGIVIVTYAIWKNTYVSKCAEEQRKVLEEKDLI